MMTPEDALEYCLTEIRSGRKTLSECAQLHPDIETALRAALALQNLRALTLRRESARALDARLRQALRPTRLPLPARVMRRAAAGLIVVLVFIGISVGTVQVSAKSLPGEALYGVKRVAEAVQLRLTGPGARAQLYNSLVQTRLAELSTLVERGAVEEAAVASLADEVTQLTQAALAAVSSAPAAHQGELMRAIVIDIEQQQALLEAVTGAAAHHQSEIMRTLSISADIQSDALERLERIDPSAYATLIPSLSSATATPLALTATPRKHANTPPGQVTASSNVPTTTPRPPARPSGTATATMDASATSIAPSGISSPTRQPTQTAPGNSAGCHGNNPNCASPQVVDITSTVSAVLTSSVSESATPTACPTNPSGKPKCKP